MRAVVVAFVAADDLPRHVGLEADRAVAAVVDEATRLARPGVYAGAGGGSEGSLLGLPQNLRRHTPPVMRDQR